MQETLETPEANQPNAPPPTPRDLQRSALRDLVALATECAATEAEIESKFKLAQEKNQKDLQHGLWEVEARERTLNESIEKKHADRLANVEAQSNAELGALKSGDTATRTRIEQEAKSIERDVKKKYEQAAWLAESVYDGTAASAHEDFKKAKEQFEQDNIYLDEREQDTRATLERYRFAPPAIPGAVDEVPAAVEDPKAAFEEGQRSLEMKLDALKSLGLPKLFTGIWPAVLLFLLVVLGGGLAHGYTVYKGGTEPDLKLIGYAAGGTLIGAIILGVVLRILANSKTRAGYGELRLAMDEARRLARVKLDFAANKREQAINDAAGRRDDETKGARQKLEPVIVQSRQRKDSALQAALAEFNRQLPLIQARREKGRGEVEQHHAGKVAESKQKQERELAQVRERHARKEAEAKRAHDEARAALEGRLRDGLATIQTPMDRGEDGAGAPLTWGSPAWGEWKPPRAFPAGVAVGKMEVDLRRFARAVTEEKPGEGEEGEGAEKEPASAEDAMRLELPGAFNVPVALGFPQQASLLIQTDRGGRDEGIAILQMTMARLLTMLPAGRARFVILDPVGLGQNFAGFMHLADHDEALVGGRIWTERDQIEQRLADLTEHMETVIQKYLRNEFETIDDYNAQAGELAEPYRFLVIADFPAGFEQDAMNRLSSIINSGARCGIYTLILRDTRQPLPPGTLLDELEEHSLNIVRQGEKWVWKDEVFKQFPLAVDSPPSDEFLIRILDVVGRAAKEANRVEVPFDTIAPHGEQVWSMSAGDELRVPVGRMGATRLQYVRLGKGVAQHALIAGKTGSGKSTLLHVLVTNLALWYAPDEVEFYLIDFKKGVEFKTYATHELPHARAIAVESDREFGLSVLQRLDAELTRRGNFYRKLGVQDLPAYRGAVKGLSGDEYPVLPRTLLIIDEFQEFFSEDDKLAQDASLLLDRLVRQGRAFGIHVLLGSQTIGGTSGLPRSTIGQMAVRVALQTSEADSQLILGDGNSAARLLSRPGEAVYNDAGGLVEANSPFQVSWLPDEQRERWLQLVQKKAHGVARGPAAIVFEGNAPADIDKNEKLAASLNAPRYATDGGAPVAYLGEPVAIKEPTAVSFRRQSGNNMLIIGQQEESALALILASMVSLAAQQSPGQAKFYVFDGTPTDSPLAGTFARVRPTIPHEVKLVEYRAVPEGIAELAEELERRRGVTDGGEGQWPSVYVVIYALQRYRALRKQEDSFSFSGSDEEKKPQADKQFADLLREGPAMGIHIIAWCDTPASVERTFDRNMMREFDNRVLFQMSAADSSNLIDSPLANKLGFHRALLYSEEQGLLEKFRPYAVPGGEWLEGVGVKLAGRQ